MCALSSVKLFSVSAANAYALSSNLELTQNKKTELMFFVNKSGAPQFHREDFKRFGEDSHKINAASMTVTAMTIERIEKIAIYVFGAQNSSLNFDIFYLYMFIFKNALPLLLTVDN